MRDDDDDDDDDECSVMEKSRITGYLRQFIQNGILPSCNESCMYILKTSHYFSRHLILCKQDNKCTYFIHLLH